MLAVRDLDEVVAAAPGDRLWAALGESGHLDDLGPPALGRLLQTVDAHHPVGATLGVCVQAATALPLLQQTAPGVAAEVRAGRAVVALAATDAGAGSDLTALDCTARIGDDHVEVSGDKRWITNATRADWLLVLARHRPGRHFTSFTWVLVPATAPGVRIRATGTDLFAGAALGDITLEHVRLSRDHVLGRVGGGLALFGRHIATERRAGAQWAAALCRRVLATTVEWLRTRRYGEGVLWDLATVRHQVAQAVVATAGLRALTAAGDADPSVLKAHAAATATSVLDVCAHLRGADGFERGGLHRLRAEVALFGVGGGPSELTLDLVADGVDALL
jgi:citronellyl-CoA dehydrogenase